METASGCRGSDFVEHALSDFSFAELAPFPALGAKDFVEVLVGESDATEPDLGFAASDFLQLGASSEMKQVRRGRGSLPLALGNGEVTVKNETDSF